MTVSFRPRTGDYFLSEVDGVRYNFTEFVKFPSPYWGLFFIQFKEENNIINPKIIVSVPVLGIIFLSRGR